MHPSIHTYIHTYLRTYIHTYIHTYIERENEAGRGREKLALSTHPSLPQKGYFPHTSHQLWGPPESQFLVQLSLQILDDVEQQQNMQLHTLPDVELKGKN